MEDSEWKPYFFKETAHPFEEEVADFINVRGDEND